MLFSYSGALLWAEMGVDGVNVGAKGGGGNGVFARYFFTASSMIFSFFLVHNMERLSIPIESWALRSQAQDVFPR